MSAPLPGDHGAIDAILRSQRQLLRSIIDRIPAFIAYVDGEKRYRLFNRYYEEWYADVSLRDASFSEVHEQDALSSLLPLLERALAGDPVRFPAQMERNGVRRHFDVQYIPHQPESETIEGVVIHALDVTDRIESAQRVEASERRLRSLTEAWAGIIWYADAQGRLIEAPGWEELTGQSQQEHRDTGWQDAIHPLDRERVRSIWATCTRSNSPSIFDLEFRVLTREGEARHTTLRAVPVMDAAGDVTEWIVGIRDIHERHVVEQQLRRAEAEQHALLDNLPKMVWIAEPNGAIRYQNRYWYEFSGLGDGSSWQEITHPDDLAIGIHAWEQAIETGKPLSVELRFRRASDGQYRWHIVRGQPLLDDHGRLRCWYGASTDIEDQKRALETLAAANQRVSRFLAVLSHELRNPLSGMSAAIELLLREDPDAQQRDQALMTLQRQNRHLQRMIEDLLDISRVTQGHLDLRREHVELGALLDEVRSDNLARAHSEGLRIEPVNVTAPQYVHGDRARLRQVFDNLISNAIKASTQGQCIRIDIGAEADHAVVVVSDEGQGLAPEIATKLFEPFVQTPTWRSHGLGLGLNIVKTLVELHEGTVIATSEGPGNGSRFIVRLPQAGEDVETMAVSPEDSSTAASTPTLLGRILIVDDESDTADAIRTLLMLEGHQVVVAGDAEAALSAWRASPFEVVLCDLQLPGPLSGYDVGRALRLQSRPPYLIAYSGYGQSDDRRHTEEAGFHEHLVKPSAIEDILMAIERGLRHMRQAP